MQVDETEARRRRCANCEYYDNTPETQVKMERIPWNQWDVGAGFRGFCTKFSFCCHDLRCCQAWEEKEFEGECRVGYADERGKRLAEQVDEW